MDNYTDSDTNVSTPLPKSGTITVHEDYFSALHKITQPEKLVACSLYFSRRWMPELGPLGTQIVLILRSLGYYNRKTNELRDGVEIDLPALADLVGVHQATIKREFARNVALGKFVTRESQYRQCPITKKPLRTTNVYRVKMDDPLHPDDQEAFEAELYAKDKGGRRAQSATNTDIRTTDPKAQYAPNDVQAVTEAAQAVIEAKQSAQENVQIAPTLIDYFYLPKNTINTETTKTSPPAPLKGGAAFGAVSVSLLEQEAVEETEEEKAEKSAAALMAQARKEVYKRQKGNYLPDGELTRQVEERLAELKAEAAKEATE